jgi:hypothetical protein
VFVLFVMSFFTTKQFKIFELTSDVEIYKKNVEEDKFLKARSKT